MTISGSASKLRISVSFGYIWREASLPAVMLPMMSSTPSISAALMACKVHDGKLAIYDLEEAEAQDAILTVKPSLYSSRS